MNIIAIIPARMGSSRFPGKPMEKILGKPMIGHVYERVIQNKLLSEVVVATCDKKIFDYIQEIGGLSVLTSDKHERASDRCAEALLSIEKENNIKYNIVVMIQGDEPMIHPDMINEAVQPMIDNSEILVTNLLGKIKNDLEFKDQNCIKVVCDLKNCALYFSRNPIPSRSRIKNIPMGKQVCVIPFKRDFLLEYTKMEPTPLEKIESVDMLRILEHGYKIHMVATEYDTHAVDTIEDLRKVETLIRV